MRRLALALLAALAPAAAGLGGPPALRILTMKPLVVTGTHFRAAERVTVRAAGITRVVRTTRAGTFRAELGTITGDRCSMSIVAVGARGERVVFPLALHAMCAPATTP